MKGSVFKVIREIQSKEMTCILEISASAPFFIHFNRGRIVNYDEWGWDNNFVSFMVNTGLLGIDGYELARKELAASPKNLIDVMISECKVPSDGVKKAFQAYLGSRLVEFELNKYEYTILDDEVYEDMNVRVYINMELFVKGLELLGPRIAEFDNLPELFKGEIIVIDRSCGLTGGSFIASYFHYGSDFSAFLLAFLDCRQSGKCVFKGVKYTSVFIKTISIILSVIFILFFAYMAFNDHSAAKEESARISSESQIFKDGIDKVVSGIGTPAKR